MNVSHTFGQPSRSRNAQGYYSTAFEVCFSGYLKAYHYALGFCGRNTEENKGPLPNCNI